MRYEPRLKTGFPRRARIGHRLAGLSLALAAVLSCAAAVETSANSANWRRAYVIDAGLATLRASPGLHSGLLKRLRHGRMVAIVSKTRAVDGIEWVRVAVTRRTRGWLPLAAIAWAGDREGERRLAWRLGSTSGFARLELARLALDRFPRLREVAGVAFAAEAERAAAELTRRAMRRFPNSGAIAAEELRQRMLLDPLLDRYVRLGVRFDADPASLSYRAVQSRER